VCPPALERRADPINRCASRASTVRPFLECGGTEPGPHSGCAIFGHCRDPLGRWNGYTHFHARLPVVASVTNLDKESLVKILSEPKNALVKQYTRLFEMDGVELEFTEEAPDAIADQAIHRGTGARGLRAIMEEVLLPVM
jgi:hypothetical protein